MNVHHHIEHPFLCVKSSPFGWALSVGECRSEMVELCGEMVVGDIRFFPSGDALLQELRRHGVKEGEVARLRVAMAAR